MHVCNAREPPIADTMVFGLTVTSVGSELIHTVFPDIDAALK